MVLPNIGANIEHYKPTDDRVTTGKVVELLDSQFVYEVHKIIQKGREWIPADKTSTRVCDDENWDVIDPA